MIVYVESNFPLELARAQTNAPAAEQILRFAESGRIKLIVPVIAFLEPFSTLTYYGSRRNEFVGELERNVRELSRSLPHKSLATILQPLGPALVQAARDEVDVLKKTIDRMLACSKQIPLTIENFRQAGQIEKRFGLSPQDAIVYAAVLSDLADQAVDQEKCFISQNKNDFSDRDIVRSLSDLGCKYLASFSSAVQLFSARG